MNTIARGLLLASMTTSIGHEARAQTAPLTGVQLNVTTVEDSASYYIYAYSIINSSASTWGLASVNIDISASSGTPENLPSTGTLRDFTTAGSVQPHAEVGPITPSPWRAILSADAQLGWAVASSLFSSPDSVSPGDTLAGFGIRSSYLPGLRATFGTPTVNSCCQEPTDTSTDIYPSPFGYRSFGSTIAPRYMPSEVTLDLLQSQLTAVCTDPLWLDDANLCSQLTDSLDAIESRLASSDNSGARTSLEGVLTILDAEREPSGPIEDNAYWLLRLNTAHVLSTIPGGPVTLFATGDTDLRQGTPNQNQGDEDVLSIRASGRHRALIQFDSAQIASVAGSVASARLEFEIVLNAENWGTQGRTIDAHRMLVPWTESGATWNCPEDTDPEDSTPDCDGSEWEMTSLNPSPYTSTASGTLLVTGDLDGTVSIDVTSDVQAMMAGQVGSYGWIVRKTDEGAAGRIEIESRESGMGPRLVIEPGSE